MATMRHSVYLHVLSTFNIILIGLATNGSTFCEHVRCENNNPCRTIFSNGKGDSHVSAECVCHGKWAGTLCESQIHVTPGVVTSSSAEVVISFKSPHTNTVHPNENSFSYTLMYWNNSTDHACALLQELTSQSHHVVGLEPSTDYTICVESGIVETCFLTYHNDTTLSTNCLVVTTGEIPSHSHSNNAAAIAASILIVVVVLAILFAAIILRRRHFLLVDNLCGLCRCACCRKKRPRETMAATDLIVSPDSPLMETSTKLDFAPSSPGKPKHRLLKQRTRGYAAYSTKNEKKIVLTTVLEYNQDGELLETDPLSHIT
ncbi:uncharacterized protein LOC124259989 [Haliotis rubra]|uniref:uncharacterized protein LOC124259989 n=1 Tax=Haliotis rubra TaxID=36100 RepID=UPI001EE55ECC|nr:uncharacterized protein LOC124259989 [Haliotis rubra]XP_046550175.1 uncharacterized protein LOC124259989 [Haliotis rubra]